MIPYDPLTGCHWLSLVTCALRMSSDPPRKRESYHARKKKTMETAAADVADTRQRSQSATATTGHGTVGQKRAQRLGFRHDRSALVRTDDLRLSRAGLEERISTSITKQQAAQLYWQLEAYPESGITIFENLMKSLGVGAVPLGSDEEDWIGNFMVILHQKLSANCDKSPLIPKTSLRLMVCHSELVR